MIRSRVIDVAALVSGPFVLVALIVGVLYANLVLLGFAVVIGLLLLILWRMPTRLEGSERDRTDDEVPFGRDP